MEPKYIVIEMQNGSIGGNNWAYDDRADAEVKFYQVIAEVVKSPVEVHTVMLVTGEGFVLDCKCYKHELEPESEPQEDDFDQEPTVESEGASDGVSGPYDGMTKAQLLELAQQRGIEAYESWTKAQIIEALTGAE